MPSARDDFVFVKVSEGQSWKSKEAPKLVRVARDAGLVVGFYHFLWPSSASGSPAKQADWFVACARNAGMKDGDLLVCDWEGTGGGVPSQADKDNFMKAVAKLVGNRNKVGLYVNRSMWNNSNKTKGDFLWLAVYGSSPDIDGWTFWQYTDKPMDQNKAAFGSRADLKSWASS